MEAMRRVISCRELSSYLFSSCGVTIAAFSIDEATGELTLIGHATEGIQFPRAFNFDPTGKWLYAANQKGDTIVQFEINQETGELTPTGLVIDTPVPVSLVFKTQ